MCIQYCDDGDKSAVATIVEKIRDNVISAEDVVKFLRWEFIDEEAKQLPRDIEIEKIVGRRINRDDTIAYIRFHHEWFMTIDEFKAWFQGVQ